MSLCPNCNAPLESLPHKRPKKFCNSTCRSNYWQKQQRLKQKGEAGAEKPLSEEKAAPATPPPPADVPKAGPLALRTYYELLQIAPTVKERAAREAFVREFSTHPRLSAPQKAMLHSKLPPLQE